MQLFSELEILGVVFSQYQLRERRENFSPPKIKRKSWFDFCRRGRKHWNIPQCWEIQGRHDMLLFFVASCLNFLLSSISFSPLFSIPSQSIALSHLQLILSTMLLLHLKDELVWVPHWADGLYYTSGICFSLSVMNTSVSLFFLHSCAFFQ